MKAIVQHEYGAPQDVLRLAEVDMPVVGAQDVLVSVRASSANPWDWHYIRGEPVLFRPALGGIRKPKFKVAGGDLAGTVRQAGSGVTAFKPGDDVYGFGHGAFAEYIAVPHGSLALKPQSLTFEQAAAVPVAALTALQGLRDKAGIRAGQRVLVIGASGGVGTFAVQIAKTFDAVVTGVCSTRNVEMVRSIGADRVIDYTRDDFTQGAQRYDLILDCAGNHSLSALRRILNRTGTCVIVGGPSGYWIGPLVAVLKVLVYSLFIRQTFAVILAKLSHDDLILLRDFLEAGKITPVIDRRYKLSELPEAIRYLEQGHARGKVVIAIGEP